MQVSWLRVLTDATPPKPGSANLFGVILYTDAHVYVKEVVADENYWKALNERSGTRWTVFAARGVPRPQSRGFVRDADKEPEANKELLAQFQLESTKTFPVLMVYAQDAQGNLRQRAISIKGSSKDEVFKSLSDSLETIAAALDKFLDENLRVETRAFDVVGEQLDAKDQWEVIKKVPGVLFTIYDWVKKRLP